MAFTASTAYVTEIRLAGLVVLRDVIETFAASHDPAYNDAVLLEQCQAPITAALTPAFYSDSTPEILASAVHACAIFVGCGVVKDVGRMGRILKLLIAALVQIRMLSLRETGELSPNASAMLRISTLSAWAQLQVSSVQQQYDAAFTATSQPSVFEAMDVYKLKILKEGDAAVPLIKIVFALAARTSSLTVVRHLPSVDYNAVVYEIWCAGISPDIFNAVEPSQANTWAALLQASYGWKTIYGGDGVDKELRMSMNPGAATDFGHWRRWARRSDE